MSFFFCLSNLTLQSTAMASAGSASKTELLSRRKTAPGRVVGFSSQPLHSSSATCLGSSTHGAPPVPSGAAAAVNAQTSGPSTARVPTAAAAAPGTAPAAATAPNTATVAAAAPSAAMSSDGLQRPSPNEHLSREVQETLLAAFERLGEASAELALMRERNAALEAELVASKRSETTLQHRLRAVRAEREQIARRRMFVFSEAAGLSVGDPPRPPFSTGAGDTGRRGVPAPNSTQHRKLQRMQELQASREEEGRAVHRKLQQALEGAAAEAAARAHAEAEVAKLKRQLGELEAALEAERELRQRAQETIEQSRQKELELRLYLEQSATMLEAPSRAH